MKRKIRGVEDDKDFSDEEEEEGKKKVKLIEEPVRELTRKDRLAKLPTIALKKRILGISEIKT